MKWVRFLFHDRVIHASVIVLSILYGLAGSLINLHRLWQYDLGYYDFGMFAVPLWKVSRFSAPVIDHFSVGGKINFADHFNPSIFLLSPLYWFTHRPEILLIAQSVLVAASGYVLFRIGLHIVKHAFLAACVVIAYFLFTGLQYAVYSDFHELTVMAFFLMVTYWAIITARKKTYWIFFILTLGFKESLFLLGIGISVFIYFYRKEWRRIAVVSGLFSVVWGYVAFRIIRTLTGGHYYYGYETDPRAMIGALFSPVIKLKTLGWTALSFIGLPLLVPPLWVLYGLHYGHRFLTEGSTRWDLGLHYNAEVAPSLAVGAFLGLQVLQKRFPQKLVVGLACCMVFVTLFLHRFVLRGPLGLAYNPAFYAHTKNFVYLDTLVSKVPPTGRIAAQNNLTPPFFHRDVRILRDNYSLHNPDYIVIDAHDGQKITNYLGIKDIKVLLQKIQKDRRYRVYYAQGDQYIFKRK